MNSWRNAGDTINESNFLEGITIFKKLNDSLYGKINTLFENLFTLHEQQQYTLPKVIVIGNESTGKSSLLENITKCKLFPRNYKLCTKCPVYIKLQNGKRNYSIMYLNDNNEKKTILIEDKKDIYKIVNDYMKKIPDNNISHNELVINISDIDMPTFEFLDLPGIRTYPDKVAIDTLEICRKYLQDKNSIVLCVVPATTPRLTAQRSIALISEMNMEKNCILALTMVDRLNLVEIESLLVKRIIGISDELNGLNLFGCVAVSNRTHENKITMLENDKNEEKWFTDNIINCIPQEYEQYRTNIINNITINNLINKMDKLYSNFIKNQWKPIMLENINIKMNELYQKYENLGSISIKPKTINNEIYNNMKKIIN